MDGKFTVVQSTTKLLDNQVSNDFPCLGLGAAVHSLMEEGTASSEQSTKGIVLCLLAMIDGLQRNVMSPDAWWLSLNIASKNLEKMGVPAEIVEKVFAAVLKNQESKRKSNPASHIYDD